MIKIPLRTGFHEPELPADQDALLTMPSVPRTGGLNLVGKGRSARVTGGDLGGVRAIASGTFDEVHFDNLRGDFRAKPSDAIGLACVARTVWVQNCRLTGISGKHSGFHGDGIQVYDKARINLLAITNTTIASGYQGIMAWANNKGEGLNTLYLDRVNIRDEPLLRSELSFALYLGDRPGDGFKTAPYTIILGEVWVDWPDRLKALFLPIGAKVVGSIKHGIPPGGDFCP